MYVYLSDEATAMLADLMASGIYGDGIDRVAENLILDQLKFLTGTSGWGEFFERKHRERQAKAGDGIAADDGAGPIVLEPGLHPAGCNCDQCVPF